MSDEAQTQQEPVEAPATIDIPEPAEPANDNNQDSQPQAASPNGPPTQRQTRGERKEERYRLVQRMEEADRRAATAEAARKHLEARLAEVDARQRMMEQRAQAGAEDPHQKKIQEAHENAWKKLRAAAASPDPATSESSMREYHEALTAASEAAAERRMEAQLQRFRQSQPDPAQSRAWGVLTGEFEWLEQNHAARAMADGYIGYLVNKGRPNTMATYREACALAAKQFGLGGAATERPSDARRAAYGGVPGRAGAADADDGTTQIQVPREDVAKLERMAHLRYPELEKGDAYKKWLGREGKAMATKK